MTLPIVNLIVTEQLYSSLGNILCTTIPVVKGSDNLLGFVDSLVSNRNPLDAANSWPNGGPFDTDSDVVNWAWANNTTITDADRQYAYQGSFPEGNPLLRQSQSSQAGQDFSIEGETGSANHSVNYTPGYLPSGVDSVLPSLFIDEGSITSLYTELTCSGSETSLGNLGMIRRAKVKDFGSRMLAKITVDDNGNDILTTNLYLTGAQFNSVANEAFINQKQIVLPNYYALNDTAQIVSTDTNTLGQNIAQISHDSGTQLNYYDVYGRLRFSQTADQASAGTVIYYLYDALNRLIESGFISMDWDVSTFETLTLQPNASQLPNTITTNALRLWAYDQSENASNFLLETIGKPTQITSYNTILDTNNVTIVNTSSQLIEQYVYDYLGRGTTFTQTFNAGISYNTNYTYDSLNKITILFYPNEANSTSTFAVYRGYNLQGRLNSLGSSSNPTAYATYQYNEFGQVFEENIGTNGQGVSYTYGNTLNQLTAYSDIYQLMSTNLSYLDSNGYYQAGNIQSVRHTFDTDTLVVNSTAIQPYSYTYTYDTFNRLTAADAQNSDSSSNTAWSMDSITIDANNNLQSYTLGGTETTYIYTPGNAHPTYTTGNNQVKNINNGTNFTYSDSGLTLTTPNGLTLSYDLVTPLPISVTNGGDTISFIYDGRGERYQKSDSNTTITYLRDTSARPLVEVMTDSTNNTTEIYYVYGPKGLVSISDGTTNYVVLKDHLGSTRIVHEDVASSAMSSANVLGYFNYLPYGGLMSDNSQQNTNLLTCRYLYTGQEWDSELSLYNYHARQYDPVLSRFYTPDSAHQFASPYVYVGNNPIGFKDVTGAVTIDALAALLRTGPIFLGENHTQTYALETISALMQRQGVVQNFSVELSLPPVRVADNELTDPLSTTNLRATLLGRPNPDVEQNWDLQRWALENTMPREYNPAANLDLIQDAIEKGIPVHFHDTPLIDGRQGNEETVGERNIFSADYINGAGINQPGTVVLAGNDHYNPNLGDNALHTLLGQNDNSRVFNLTTEAATDGAVAPIAQNANTITMNNIFQDNAIANTATVTQTTESMATDMSQVVGKSSKGFCGSCDIL